MQGWLDRIAEEQGPLAAWKCINDVIEFHIPRLARSEITGKDGEAVKHSITVEFVRPSS